MAVDESVQRLSEDGASLTVTGVEGVKHVVPVAPTRCGRWGASNSYGSTVRVKQAH